MRLDALTRLVPKPGSPGEDAAHPATPVRASRRGGRFAVADGATTSLCAHRWAHEVAQAYCRDGLPDRRLGAIVRRLRRAWLHEAGGHARGWVQRAQLRAGAGATLAGLTLRDAAFYEEEEGGRWTCLIVGDCALFQVRQDRLTASLPFADWAEAPPCPHMLMTDPARNRGLPLLRHAGWWRDGDVFYLMSDAIAGWFGREAARGAAPWSELDAVLQEPRRFERWVQHQRRAGRLVVDDVVVTRVRVGG